MSVDKQPFDDDFYFVNETERHYTCKTCGHRFKLIEIPKNGHVNCSSCGLAYDVDSNGKLQIRWANY